jgi:hypothetical protein
MVRMDDLGKLSTKELKRRIRDMELTERGLSRKNVIFLTLLLELDSRGSVAESDKS